MALKITPSNSRLEEMDLKRYVIGQNVVSNAYPPNLRDVVPPGTRTARAYYGLTRDAPVIRLAGNFMPIIIYANGFPLFFHSFVYLFI